MTPDELRAALRRLHLTQVGAAKVFGVDGRTVRKWCAGKSNVPGSIELALSMLEDLSPDERVKWLTRRTDPAPTSSEPK